MNGQTHTVNALLLHWNGTSWSIVPSPSPGAMPGNVLHGVACTAASNCWAVGYKFDGSATAALIERWNGISWSIVTAPDGSSSFDSVTCAAASDCWATASFGNTLAHWDGLAWTLASLPAAGGAAFTQLGRVACTSPADCWVVGYSYHGGAQYRTLIEHWNGQAWSIVISPSPDPAENFLYGVTCPSTSLCWAVGQFNNSNGFGTLIEKWDGNAWTFLSSPNNPDASVNSLFGVTCTSSADCWAVGSSGEDGEPLAEHWNGSSWSVVATPNPSVNYFSRLNDIACTSAAACWAVGFYDGQPLIERWDGSAWTFAVVPPPLTAVSSRKIHGSAGAFDIDLPRTGNVGIECRSGGANGNHQVIFTFANNLASVGSAYGVSATVTSSAIGPNPNQYTVNLTGLENARDAQVYVNLAEDSAGNIGGVYARMAALLGDVSGNGSTNASDVGQAKALAGATVGASNFRADVNASGSINASDVALVKSAVGTSLPP